jgi:hypothetical protein
LKLSPLIDRINATQHLDRGRVSNQILIVWARKQRSDPSATDVLIQHLQDALQVHDSRRMVPAGYRLKRIGEMLDELNILGTLDDRCVHAIE